LFTEENEAKMRICIPLLGERVAPRYNIADTLLLLTLHHARITSRTKLPSTGRTWIDFKKVLTEQAVNVLVCGGIKREDRESIRSQRICIIENVACTAAEAIDALKQGTLRPGFGFTATGQSAQHQRGNPERPAMASSGIGIPIENQARQPGVESAPGPDCLACRERICLQGEPCRPPLPGGPPACTLEQQVVLEAARDIAFEEERTLCRLAELVYLCLEMKYRKIGVAFCIELVEPAEILTGVLRRFFTVYPVCCKIGGISMADPYSAVPESSTEPANKRIACNPLAQAEALHAVGTDLNIIVGLCVGVDCIFTMASHAPVTTLFVKDKSLANNPIGALYSDYYLKEATRSRIFGARHYWSDGARK
jgi:uncharacterized metal-binding protein/predicted Fe-Mo cluster-binding NifX family protein